MQAPKHEVFMLNWEIFDLNKKLQTFANVYSVIDVWTVDCLSQLITTVDAIMTKTTVKPYGDWDKKDKQIFQAYSFHHSINCKKCDRAVKITKPSLQKHLKECTFTTNKSITKQAIFKEVLGIALGVPKKSTNGNEAKASSSSVSVQPKRDTSSQSTSTVTSKKNRRKQTDNQNKLTVQNTKSKITATNPTTTSKSDTPTKPNPTVPSEQVNDSKTPKKDKPTEESISEKPANIKSKPTATASTKQQKPDEPKRKVHKPNRSRDGEYVIIGSIPDQKVDLTKKTKKFINNVEPLSRIMAGYASRKELSNSPAHDNIVKTLEDLFKSSYPKAKAYPFGSRITGLGNEASDLDIYFDLEDNYDGSLKYTKDKIKSCVLLTEEYLKTSDKWSKLDPVTSARTPILRAWNKEEKIDCDISFTHGLSHCNTKLIQYLFDLQPVCFYVAFYAKEWSRNFSMDGLNTYTLVLLTFYYFQKHKLLPCIHSLQNNCKDPMFISHWQANFERKSLEELGISQIPETEAEKHIMRFFSFYGAQFCFDTRVVCPFLGWAPHKEDFDPSHPIIPLEMENLQKYYDGIYLREAHPVNDLLSYMKPMVVQDPFELNHNVAKGISPADVDRFRKFCALTANHLVLKC